MDRMTLQAQEDDALFFSLRGRTSRLQLCQGVVSLCPKNAASHREPNLNSIPFFLLNTQNNNDIVCPYKRALFSLAHFATSANFGYFLSNFVSVSAVLGGSVCVCVSNFVRFADSAGRRRGIR